MTIVSSLDYTIPLNVTLTLEACITTARWDIMWLHFISFDLLYAYMGNYKPLIIGVNKKIFYKASYSLSNPKNQC